MYPTIINIKNMVCDRCLRVVREELEKLDLEIENIELGCVTIAGKVKDYNQIKDALRLSGFDLLEDERDEVVEKIKTLIINHIHHQKPEVLKLNYSDYLSQELGKNYQYLSKSFSAVEGLTIEKYIIRQKIERAKELISYNKLSLSEIAYQLEYNNVTYLSAQFKQVTGMTATTFKGLVMNEKTKYRVGLDTI